MKQLQNRVAVVTGASSGIGRAIAEVFAAEGAKVVLAARRGLVLQEVAAGIGANGGTAIAAPADVTREEDVKAVFAKAVDSYGRVDILVNNAGTFIGAPTEEMTLSFWREIVDVNLTAAFLCSREALRLMKKQGGGRIINMGSISGLTPRPHSIGYTATKFGLEGLTRSLTHDGRAYGVVASIIRPGATATAVTAGRQPGPGETPQDYLMAPEHIARVALLMCALPPEVNFYDATVLPNHQPSFIGRG